jgi:hypothetical protein
LSVLRGTFHVDRALESRPVLEIDPRCHQVARHLAGGFDDDLLFSVQVSDHLTFDVDGFGVDVRLDLARFADRYILTSERDLALDAALNSQVLLASHLTFDGDTGTDHGD